MSQKKVPLVAIWTSKPTLKHKLRPEAAGNFIPNFFPHVLFLSAQKVRWKSNSGSKSDSDSSGRA